jgi:glucose/arabinose dehydrogenase
MRRGLALLALTLAFPVDAVARHRLATVGRFVEPVYVAGAPRDARRVFVVERAGRIVVVRGGRRLRAPFLDLRGHVSTSGEQGLLSIAFAPDYARSRRFYVDYTDHDGDILVREFRRSRDPDRALANSGRTLLSIEHSSFEHHYGGQLAFGPDALLYIGVGDGGGVGDPFGHAQDLGSLMGKLLRIDPRTTPYGIPADNPFVSVTGARPEIYAYGLRNPWRFSFDDHTGDLAIGDVGQDKYEEIDFAPRGTAAGANFGWNRYEGRHPYKRGPAPAGYVPPMVERSHRDGFCAIVGGYVVRDRGLPGLYGRYVYGDDCSPRIYSVTLGRGHASRSRVVFGHLRHIVSFGEDSLRHIYVVSLAGPVYRLTG